MCPFNFKAMTLLLQSCYCPECNLRKCERPLWVVSSHSNLSSILAINCKLIGQLTLNMLTYVQCKSVGNFNRVAYVIWLNSAILFSEKCYRLCT